MGTIKKEIAIGFFVSLFILVAGIFLCLQYFYGYAFEETIVLIKKGNLHGKIITLATIPNIFVFFIFLKKKQDYRARGVLLVTILTAFITLLLKFT